MPRNFSQCFESQRKHYTGNINQEKHCNCSCWSQIIHCTAGGAEWGQESQGMDRYRKIKATSLCSPVAGKPSLAWKAGRQGAGSHLCTHPQTKSSSSCYERSVATAVVTTQQQHTILHSLLANTPPVLKNPHILLITAFGARRKQCAAKCCAQGWYTLPLLHHFIQL